MYKMQFFKALSLLLLLIPANIAIASTTNFPATWDYDENILEVSQDHPELLESTLTTPGFIQPHRDFPVEVSNFNFQSSSKESESKIYIDISRYIYPALGIPEIIFPFHSFL